MVARCCSRHQFICVDSLQSISIYLTMIFQYLYLIWPYSRFICFFFFVVIRFRWKTNASRWWCDVGRWARRNRRPSNTSKWSMCIHRAELSKYKIQMKLGAIIARCSHTMPSMIHSESHFSEFFFSSFLPSIYVWNSMNAASSGVFVCIFAIKISWAWSILLLV